MTTKYIKASGGDYTDIQTAVDAYPGGAVWELIIDDSRNYDEVVTIDEGSDATDYIKITVSSANRHSGKEGAGHARVYPTSNPSTGRVFTVSDAGVIIEWLDIQLYSTDTSDEAIRYTHSLTVNNCIIHATEHVDYQDGIYIPNESADLTVSQCYIYGFSRGGIHWQNYSGSCSGDIDVNSTFIWNCGPAGEPDSTSAGGIVVRSDLGTKNANVLNTSVLDCSGAYSDYFSVGTVTWGISYSIDSDNSITARDSGGTGNLPSRTLTASTSPGTGDWVMVQNITTAPDLTLQSHAENDALDAHAVATAEGLTIPSTDIVGTSRPVNTDYDIGPFEYTTTGTSFSVSPEDAGVLILVQPPITGEVPPCALYSETGEVVLSADDEIVLVAGCVGPNDGDIAVGSSEPALTMHQGLSVNDAAIGVASTQPALGAKWLVSPNNADIATSSAQPQLDSTQAVLPANSAIGTASTQPALSASWTVEPGDVAVGVASTQPSIVTLQSVPPADAAVGVASTQPALSNAQLVAVNDAAIQIEVTPTWLDDPPFCAILENDGVTPIWGADGDYIYSANCVAPADADIGVASTEPALSASWTVEPADVAVGISTDQPQLDSLQVTAPNDAAIQPNASQPTLVLHTPQITSPNDAAVLIGSTEPVLTLHVGAAQSVSPNDAAVGIAATVCALSSKQVIIAADVSVAVSASSPAWSPDYVLPHTGTTDETNRYTAEDSTSAYTAGAVVRRYRADAA